MKPIDKISIAEMEDMYKILELGDLGHIINLEKIEKIEKARRNEFLTEFIETQKGIIESTNTSDEEKMEVFVQYEKFAEGKIEEINEKQRGYISAEYRDFVKRIGTEIIMEEIIIKWSNFIQNNANKINKNDILIEFMKKNEDDIDKEKALLISLQKHLELKDTLGGKNNSEYGKYFQDKEKIQKNIEKLKKMGEEFLKGRDISISRLEYQKTINKVKEGEHCRIKVTSSKELSEENSLSEAERKQIRQQERETKKHIYSLPNKAVAIALSITTNIHGPLKKNIFNAEDLEIHIGDAIKFNIESEGIIAEDQWDKMSSTYQIDLSKDFAKEVFKGIEKYINVDKMCLTSFVYIVGKLEKGEILYTDGTWAQEDEKKRYGTKDEKQKYEDLNYEELYLEAEQYLQNYYNVIKDKDIEIVINGEKYTTGYATEAMKKYIDGRYMSSSMMANIIDLLVSDRKTIVNLTKNQLQYIRQELINVGAIILKEDVKTLIEVGIFDKSTILKLYENRQIDLESISEIKGSLDLKSEVTPEFILRQFDKLMVLDEPNDQYEKDTIKSNFNLYKELYLKGKSEEELEESGKALIEAINREVQADKEKSEEYRQEGLLRYKLMSERTYAILTSKGIVKPENLINMYQKNVISIETIEQLKEEGISFDNLNIEEQIIDSYIKIREEKDPDIEELKKYITLCKTLQSKELSEEDRIEEANEFICEIGDRIENNVKAGKQKREFGAEDRERLYELGVIPLETWVEWSEKEEIIDILKRGTLVPKDIRKLYQDNRILLKDFEKIINSHSIELFQKFHLLNTVFSSHEDAEIRQKLMGKIEGLEATVNSSDSSNSTNSKKSVNNKEVELESTNKVNGNKYIFDTAERYNAWIEADEKVAISLLDDGHVVFQLPNVRGGIAVIEQLYEVKNVKINGKNEKILVDKYGTKGYVLTLDEYDEFKEKFTTADNRINRSKLINIEKQLPSLEDKGIPRELRHFKHKYIRDIQTLLGVPEDLALTTTDKGLEKAIKRIEDSTEYTPEEKERILKIYALWEQVKQSRDSYRE